MRPRTRPPCLLAVVALGLVAVFAEFAANYDGKDNPITGTNLTNDAVALTRIDANATRAVYKKDGKVTTTQTAVVCSDGKTVTFRSKGTNSRAETVDNVVVYDKQ
ncbi:MAG: hypothetical protein ACM3NQ_11520 [Bacteroidales bacterium]